MKKLFVAASIAVLSMNALADISYETNIGKIHISSATMFNIGDNKVSFVEASVFARRPLDTIYICPK